MLQIESLPISLRENGLFCCWRYETREGSQKTAKVPYDPRTGRRAQSTNPDTFAPLNTAVSALEHNGYDGIGVGIFHQLGAIDIDHCIQDGELSPLALDIMNIMNAYTEISPSGQGLRILFLVPPDFQYNKARYYINHQGLGLEIYVAGATYKYVTVTGNTMTPGLDLEDCGDRLQQVMDKYMLRPDKGFSLPGISPVPKKMEPEDSDSALLDMAMQAKNGDKFKRLWEGEYSGYQSHSEADIALCSMLAFWTRRNPERMDRLFRQSGLMREKWDRPTAGGTYGAITIQNAIASCKQDYSQRDVQQNKAHCVSHSNTGGQVNLAQLHPESNRRYEWNDIGNSNLFADFYKDQARYVPERKKWFVYDGKSWNADIGDLKVMELCKTLANNLTIYALSLEDEKKREQYLKFVGHWQRRSYRETILKDAAGVYPISISQFDKNLFLLNCLNGTLDLKTRQFHPHSPSDFLSMTAGVRYDPNAQSKLWEKTIFDAMQGDQDKAAFLQKAMGYGLTGDTSEECFFILYGPTTRNGKGTIMETYIRMLGDYGRTSKPETIAQKQTANSSGPSEDIARLAHARVVNISEPGKQMVLSTALVKTLTGGDTITARFLNENSFEFTPQFKLFVNTNYLPKVTDVTIFSSDRIKVIPFERHFEESERDKSLKQRLAQDCELSAVLNWCLQGLWMMWETGLDLPNAVRDATTQYQRDSDKIGRFTDEMLEPSMGSELRTEEVYQAYQNWCTQNGLMAESMPTWKQALSTYVEIKRKRPNGMSRTATPKWFICNTKWKK